MYKVVTSNTKTKNIYFLEFLKYWPSSRDFNKLVIKVKMHVNTYFWIFIVWKCDVIFLFEIFGRMYENKNMFFYFFNFSVFWQKLGI